MRKNIVAANWKMNLDRVQAISLVDEIISNISIKPSTQVILAPSYLYLYKVSKKCNDIENIFVAAQNCSSEDNGAFTGEVSVNMIKSCNADYVIIGHSERRDKFNESNNELEIKVKKALDTGLKVIFCCGESLEQRNQEVHFKWIENQISESLFTLSKKQIRNVVIAYEPIWAIGTGVTATAKQAQEMHFFIREILLARYDKDISDNISILYGGSCNPTNAKELFSQQDIDGGLVGGASLSADNFLAITNSF